MSEKKRKGTPLWQISKKFNFAAECRFNAGGSCVIIDSLSHWTCRIVNVLVGWLKQPVHTGIPDGPDGCCLCNMCSKPTGFQVT